MEGNTLSTRARYLVALPPVTWSHGSTDPLAAVLEVPVSVLRSTVRLACYIGCTESGSTF